MSPRPRGQLTHPSHFIIGRDPRRWTTGVRNYGEVAYEGLYDGIDVRFRPGGGGLKYDVVASPDADLDEVRLRFEGAVRLWIDAAGDLVVETAAGSIRDAAPHGVIEGTGREAGCRYVLEGRLTAGFSCPGWDGDRRLIIDPVVQSTYLGSSGDDLAHAVAVDGGGNIYVAGQTEGPDFPAQNGVFTEHAGGSWVDAFVAKIAPGGTELIYATYLGGTDWDAANGIAPDAAGAVAVVGQTRSADFAVTDPITAPFCSFDDVHGSPSGGFDAFVSTLSVDGSSLDSSNFLGGSGDDGARGIAIAGSFDGDPSPNSDLFVIGFTTSSDFPIVYGELSPPAWPGWSELKGNMDAFLVKMRACGSGPKPPGIIRSVYLGGSADDSGEAIAVDLMDYVYTTGQTYSTDFPAWWGFQQTGGGAVQDAFVVKHNPTFQALEASTYLGGSGRDQGLSIALRRSPTSTRAEPYILGYTQSPDFPVQAALDGELGGESDVFVTGLDEFLQLRYSTYLGGSASEQHVGGIRADFTDTVWVAGGTYSTDFPTASPDSGTLEGVRDGFVTKLWWDAEGSSLNLVYSTYLGGSGEDYAAGLAVQGSGEIHVAGGTRSVDFPGTETSPIDPTPNGGWDAFTTTLTTP